MNTARISITVLVLLAPGSTARAQRSSSSGHEQESARPAIVGGVAWGAAGFLAGGLTGAVAAGDCGDEYDEFCRLAGAFVGAAMGGTFGMALGVHRGNKRRGNFGLDLLTGAAIWVAGISVAAAGNWDEPLTTTMFVAIPIAQIAATVAVERGTGRSRANARRVSLRVVPESHGRARVVGRITL